MKHWPRNPLLYEINTWVWLQEISRRCGRRVDLSTVPAEYWESIAESGFDAVWLMGIWERSPRSIRISLADDRLVASFRHALPDFTAADDVGSPYSVRRYTVDLHLGGPEGLAVARERIAAAGLHLVLDFVANHVAPDHPWAQEHPEYFILGTADDLLKDPACFFDVEGNVMARGRDPYFPPWPDVLQLNTFAEGWRTAAVATLNSIALQCDGVRCDMAMLAVNRIFARTWGTCAGSEPEREFWMEVIPAIKQQHPDFVFIAEAYWDLEWELQQQGFDYCYDKRLYDRLSRDSAESTRLHLSAAVEYQSRLVRFLENHDEPRAASTFCPARHRAAAVAALTLPGMRLLHEGQMEGRQAHLPVFLARRPDEPADKALEAFYTLLLKAVRHRATLKGEWRLLPGSGWPDNQSNLNILSWLWADVTDRLLVIVNLSDQRSQCLVAVPDPCAGEHNVRMTDLLTAEVFERSRREMINPGLFVDLEPWTFHVLEFSE